MKKCKIEFCDSTDFATRSSMCKVHHREYTREHYRNNKDKYLERNKRSVQNVTDAVRALKAEPCTDCKKTYPWYVMEFDHLNPNVKIGAVAQLTAYGKKMVLEEIAKCELVCANCHRQRTAERAGYAL